MRPEYLLIVEHYLAKELLYTLLIDLCYAHTINSFNILLKESLYLQFGNLLEKDQIKQLLMEL
jgi:hypothetical protein